MRKISLEARSKNLWNKQDRQGREMRSLKPEWNIIIGKRSTEPKLL